MNSFTIDFKDPRRNLQHIEDKAAEEAIYFVNNSLNLDLCYIDRITVIRYHDGSLADLHIRFNQGKSYEEKLQDEAKIYH